MQITHVGRRSGKIRRTILAVLRFDGETREIYAVSAWKGSDKLSQHRSDEESPRIGTRFEL